MLKLVVFVLITFMAAPLSYGQVPPPPPPGDFPHPAPPEGKRKPGKKVRDMAEPERKGVKPPLPVTPPSPEPTPSEDVH